MREEKSRERNRKNAVPVPKKIKDYFIGRLFLNLTEKSWNQGKVRGNFTQDPTNECLSLFALSWNSRNKCHSVRTDLRKVDLKFSPVFASVVSLIVHSQLPLDLSENPVDVTVGVVGRSKAVTRKRRKVG